MPRLKSRQSQIPNGFKFYQPQTGWKPPRFASFDQIVLALIQHRKGNKALTEKHAWPMDYETVANEVDSFNARICQQMGWLDYITEADGGQPAAAPFLLRPQSPLEKLKAVAVGGRILVEWIESKEEAVPVAQATARAEVCIKCPFNEKGDWTSFFTVPTSEAIRAAESKRREWKLETPADDLLNVCSACYCPLRLKVHMKLATILSKMPQESFDRLAPDCWIRKEKSEAK